MMQNVHTGGNRCRLVQIGANQFGQAKSVQIDVNRCRPAKSVQISTNWKEILNEIPNLAQGLNEYVELNNTISEIEDHLQDLHQQLALIKEAEAQGAKNHSLYSLPSHYDAYRKSQDAMNNARKDLINIIRDCEKHMELYSSLLNLYEGQQFSQWLIDLKVKSYENCSIFDLVKEFLHNAGKDDLIVQCEQSEQETISVAYNLDNLYKDNLMQVNKLFDELTNFRTKDPNSSLEKIYSSAKTGISTFLGCEKGASDALEFVIASELVLLNRNFLTLEIAAQRSGNWLIKLTSRDGDWFLDDLLLHSSRAVEMINNLPPRQTYEDQKFCKITSGIKIANNIYKALYDLNFNFHTIILPESMKKLQAEEVSVLQLIYDINRLILDIGIPIPDIIVQLEKFLTCILMQMDVTTTYDYILQRVSATKKEYLELIPTQPGPMSQGEMLLMGFNGLFEKISQEVTNLINTLGNLDIPKSWKKLDHVKEAKNIAPHIFNLRVRSVLEDIFFLKRIKAISEFFSLAQEMCQSLKGTGAGVIFNDEQLTKPVKQFISEFISRQLLGISPEMITYSVCFLLQNLGLDVAHEIEQKDIGAESKVPLDEVYSKAWNFLLKNGTFSQNVLSQASSLETNLKLAWEKIQEPKKIEQKLTILQSSTLRMQSQLAVHNMMFDDILQLHNFASVRAKFIVDIRSEIGSLQTVYKQLMEAKDKQQSLIEKAYQRLNWAKGANPDVGEICTAFDNAVKTRDTQLDLQQKVAGNILSTYPTLLQHELLRTSTMDSTKEYDKLFLNCFEIWRLACQYIDSKTESLLPAEENILNLLTPELIKDPKWLQKISEQITEIITTTQKKLEAKRDASFSDSDNMMSLMEKFKSIYNVHCKLMSDVKSLIKAMAKIEDYSLPTQQFIQNYRQYIEHFSLLFSKFKKEINKEEVKESLQHIEYIKEHTDNIYRQLFNLESVKITNLNKPNCMKRNPEKQEPQKQDSSKGQHRNAYAVNVWRRVKLKLEGRDPDSGRKCAVQEQVDYVICEATSLDNLALLYEGWTPWV
ncbi:hypothetical protein NQ317_007425 [Molorchus minor]|uniref:FATC domain-containing protein n=1 Tax=Molorchus minor TaxID=1323400 RepID=A0ABQ9JGV2_9CUCU|nr:hypothetical protein NQ317_007425 [Molorchus minor]